MLGRIQVVAQQAAKPSTITRCHCDSCGLPGRAPLQLTEHVEGGDDPGVPVTAYEQRTQLRANSPQETDAPCDAAS